MSDSADVVLVDCDFDPPHVHEYPGDWEFGGANGLDPRADRRWRPTTYEYYNDRAERIWITQVPLCDDEALDNCTNIAGRGPGWNPVWVAAIRPDTGAEMLPWTYDKATDTLSPRESSDG